MQNLPLLLPSALEKRQQYPVVHSTEWCQMEQGLKLSCALLAYNRKVEWPTKQSSATYQVHDLRHTTLSLSALNCRLWR